MNKPTSAKSRLTLSCGVAALASALALTAPALAQEATVGEVVVTAQKRSENLQDVPLSVASVSGERLQSLFAAGDDILTLSSRVPALYAESSNGRAAPRFYIRGLGNADFDLAASQPVSVIMDDVVMENVVLKSTPLFDLDRVEVLRGPQGTLFGRNTTAGIIKFDTIRPSQTRSARGTATYGSYGTLTLDGGLGAPIIDGVLAARVSALVQRREDWIDNAFTQKNNALGGYEETAVRLQLLFTPTEDFSALLAVHNRSLDGTSAVFRANILTKGGNGLNGNYKRDKVFFDGGGNNPQAYDGSGASLRIEYKLPAATLTSISAYETTNGVSRGDIDGGNMTNGPGFIPFPSDTADGIKDLDQVTQEIRLASDADGPLSWQVGAYYFDSRMVLRTDPGFVAPTELRHENTSWAVFGQASYQIAEAWKLTAGLRWTSDEKTLTNIVAPIPFAKVNVSDEQVSWDLSAFYDVSDTVGLYGRVARGFRGPTIQGRDVAFFGAPSVAQSETILSWEAGFKSELFDRRVRLNGAVFTYTVNDPQFTAVGGSGNIVRLLNAKEGRALGFELDGEWVVNENLVLTAGYSYADTEIKDSALAVGVCAQCTVTDPLNSQNRALINGNPFPNAPESIFDVSARFSLPIGNGGELFAYTDWNVQGRTNLFLYESREFYTDGNYEGGLKIGYAREDGAWEAALFARNITDESNVKGGIDFNNNTAFVNEPRVIGVSLTARLR
ncbi:TonB-dependent receptor [Phenylobacterium sp.]|uniref:TonB-dependent receptor n=1 Tax=Phenylobacterium sp. TaxID=1871053 RepID=UPI0025E2E360|nr:TonB-dependent receptor [Phenylobacterium sp.]MCA3716097.1 TonB-dependent receptor [Phenylobacterium sp.]